MIDLARPISSYAKVRGWVGEFIRNNPLQARRERVRTVRYLDVGCGPNSHPNFINLDYGWHPEIDLCWDVRRGLPLPGGSMQGIFSEHCLEHLPVAQGEALIREFRRVLAPGGVVRIVVPDAELYLRNYVRQVDGDSAASFPYSDAPAAGEPPIRYVNRVFYLDRESPFGHCFMYDFGMLRVLLQRAGFGWVEKASFGAGRDAALLIDSRDREEESLYVEAGC